MANCFRLHGKFVISNTSALSGCMHNIITKCLIFEFHKYFESFRCTITEKCRKTDGSACWFQS